MLKSFSEAKEFLYEHIPRSNTQKFPGSLGLDRTKYLLSLLGNPQDKLKIIHVAGTSGKGSTAFYASSVLQGLGFKTGLHLSPHLLDIRERFQINNNLISKKQFVGYLNFLVPYINEVNRSKYGQVTYFEILTVLSFFIFCEKKVDYAVVETGMGGRYDATNTVSRGDKVAVITKIGLDHTNILGRTISEIAKQKSGIIKQENTVFSVKQSNPVDGIIDKTAVENDGIFYCLEKRSCFRNMRFTDAGLSFDFYFFDFVVREVFLKTKLLPQVENCGLALAVIAFLSRRDGFGFDKEKILKALEQGSFRGRMEIFKKDKVTIIADGAHNPQKMSAFISSLNKAYPSKKHIFLLAFKKGKDFRSMLKIITPLAAKIILTSFFTDDQDHVQSSEDPKKLADYLSRLNFENHITIVDPLDALKQSLTLGEDIIITGSFYLLGRLYRGLRKK
jgi:dihydrofolate synthase/folylpolyglutamate synthase